MYQYHLGKKICSPTQSKARKFGVRYEPAVLNETYVQRRNRKRRNADRLKNVSSNFGDIPEAPPILEDEHFNVALQAVRAFEIKQMSYQWNTCKICNECRIGTKNYKSGVCKRCFRDKAEIKMFSSENNMNPKAVPQELNDLTVIEQQLISRISPCINVHMLKHGGIAASGHCVTFPQEINEPAQIFPRLPSELSIIKVRKQGRNDTSKDFKIRRFKVQHALEWLKANNKAYSDILICPDRLLMLPVDGEIDDIPTVVYNADTLHGNDKGPAENQFDIGEVTGTTNSCVILPDEPRNICAEVQNIVNEVVQNPKEVTENRRGTITIPWPSRGDVPVSEFTTAYFFTLAFPCLFPYGEGDYHINRSRTCESMKDWAQHLLWYKDGRFAHHPYFKFVVHNMISRSDAIKRSMFIVQQQLGDGHLTVADLKLKLQEGDESFIKKILYFGASLRGTSQYWSQKSKELRSLIQFKINEGSGLPSFFATASCAEFHFKPLRRLLANYALETSGEVVDFTSHSNLFQSLQKNTHVVSQYFDLRTSDYFQEVMEPVFNVNAYWYRMEFAKSRGMVHWHGLCWRRDREPHNLLFEAFQEGLSDESAADRLSEWAKANFKMSASHPAGSDSDGKPRKDLWPPPEGTAPVPPEESNPLAKLLMDVSSSQQNILDDYLLLTNRINLHRCSDYCLVPPKSKREAASEKVCRMEFGKMSAPGKVLRSDPALVKDRNGSLRLEMARDHPMIVQNSQIQTQAWRANSDISLILSKSSPDNPSVQEITATEKYITGYACKGNQPTGAVADLFKDVINMSNETASSSKSLVSKLLIGTVKRDVSAIEASYELSTIPLYRSSHIFQSLSLTGARLLERNGSTVTKKSVLDRYLLRDVNDNVSLYDFACRGGKVPVISGSHTQPSWPLDESYSRTKLLLHWPSWRSISDIKDGSTPWVDAMYEFMMSGNCPNFVMAEVERAKSKTKESTETNSEDALGDDGPSDQPEWMDVVRPNVLYEDYSADFSYDDGSSDYDWKSTSINLPEVPYGNWVEKLNEKLPDVDILQIPDVNLASLNNDQKFAFDLVMKTLLDFTKEHECYEPLRLIVGGTAGSGKSYLIKCLIKAIRTFLNSNKAVQVLCPTGNSANLIAGVTLHSFLKIPSFNRTGDMVAPDGSTGEKLQSNCDGLKVLLVDERSLIGACTLGWMEFLCRHGVQRGTQVDKSWGGLPVVVFLGDDVQLPPVMDSPVYNSKSCYPAAMHGALIWQEFDKAVILKTIVRQGESEKDFRETLLAIRDSKATPHHAEWLQKFQWINLKHTHGAALLQRMSDQGVFVYPSHSEVWKHNKEKLLELNKTYPIAKINAIPKGFHSSKSSSDSSGGLLSTLYLANKAKVTLTVNLCVPFGLFNGAVGVVEDIIYLGEKRPPEVLPDFVLVDFPCYTGPAFIEERPTLLPIVPVVRLIDCSCHCCSRKQIPLRLGWASTIHRCQGMTIGAGEVNRYIVIHPGTRAFESKTPGALFVSLSRAKSTGTANTDPDFAWNPSVLVNDDRICHVVNTPTTRARYVEIARIEKLDKVTKLSFSNLNSDKELQHLSNVLNVRQASLEE